MRAVDLYVELGRILDRPAPFSIYTAETLWADPYRSEQMLAYHLNSAVDVSSRRTSFIDESVEWMVQEFDLSNGKRVLDFGCGPGLYAARLASHGAEVTGVDFSPRSIEYARREAETAEHVISFQQANYLEYEPEGVFDLIIMIMCDYCALSPAQRSVMLRKFASSMGTEGRVVLDVYSLSAFAEKAEATTVEKNSLDGFWSAAPYLGFQASFKYDDEEVILDKYTIVTEREVYEVYNWLQYFSQESLKQEFQEHGLVVESVLGDVAGSAFNPGDLEFAVVAKGA